jgi:hypothetical protein
LHRQAKHREERETCIDSGNAGLWWPGSLVLFIRKMAKFFMIFQVMCGKLSDSASHPQRHRFCNSGCSKGDSYCYKNHNFLHKERPTEKSDFLVYWTRTNHIDYFKLRIG